MLRPRPHGARTTSTSSTTTACTTCRSRWRRRCRSRWSRTLHTPPTPWLESAIQAGDACPRHVRRGQRAHGAGLARTRRRRARDPQRRRRSTAGAPGPGGGPAVWFGRLVPEKGAAPRDRRRRAGRRAARARRPDRGPRRTSTREIRPRLGRRASSYVGHLDHADARAACVGAASVAARDPVLGRALRPRRRRGARLRHAGARVRPRRAAGGASTPDCGALVAPGRRPRRWPTRDRGRRAARRATRRARHARRATARWSGWSTRYERALRARSRPRVAA